MLVTILQVVFVLALIVVIILFVFQPRRKQVAELPENYAELLADYVPFYADLDDENKRHFEERLQKFLGAVKITGANAQVEDLDRLLVGAAAIIPVFHIRDWEYIHLREVLLYPGHFNTDFDQGGTERTISGMVGNGSLENVMILSKWDLRQGFINRHDNRNTAIHEFVHLIDKLDGTLDGVPEILLERKYMAQWQALLHQTGEQIRQGLIDIDAYGATSPVECFAVVAEYFFMQPEKFRQLHPEWYALLLRVFGPRR
jgi:Mlc titration factor MtfA (ptsG expression regulator)